MAEIDQIIAGGAKTSANFDFNSLINKPYYEALDQKDKNEGRNIFKDGVPKNSDGTINYGAMRDSLFQHGDVGSGTTIDNLDVQRQSLKLGQEAAATMARLEGGGQPAPQSQIVSPPSVNRSGNATVAPPLARGGEQPGQQPKAQSGPTTIAQVLTAQGFPNDQIGPASAFIARQIGMDDPNQPIDVNDQRVRGVLIPAVQQLKRMGVGQVAQPGQPQQQPIPPVNPQQNQGTFGAPPATPTRGAVPTGADPEIQKQVATYTAIASNPAYPKPVQEAAITRLKALQEQGQPTGPIKEYDLYRRQGGNLSFKDYLADAESGKAVATERAKADIKEQQEYIDGGKLASQRLGTLNTLSNIIGSDKNLQLGFGSETTLKVKMALQQAGFDFGDLSGGELIQKLNGVLASESSKSLSTRSTQFDFKTFLANNPGLALDEKGNVRMLGILSQNAKREADLGKLARQNRDNWDNWDSVVEKYDHDHPIKDPTTGKVLSNHTIIAPGPKAGGQQRPSGGSFAGKQFASPEAARAAGAKSGDIVTDASGKQWKLR